MNTFLYRWELRKLQRKRAKVRLACKQEKEQARADNRAADEIAMIDHSAMFEEELVDDEIESLESRFLIECAERLLLPIPTVSKDSDAWRQSSQLGLNLLTRPGYGHTTINNSNRAQRTSRGQNDMDRSYHWNSRCFDRSDRGLEVLVSASCVVHTIADFSQASL